MDHKRKANSSNGAGVANGDDRAAKRHRASGDLDLAKGETHESTTIKGLAFLEQIRKTADKHGRPVAGYFEKLLPREGNEDYYQKIRLPISLETIERKLNNHEFASMSELESYMKRMVTNAKEYYPRNSEVYDDAERVRKATSNYMTKNNPAYKLIPNYSAIATPVPAEAEQERDYETKPARSSARSKKDEEEEEEEEDADAEGEDDDEDADAEADDDDDADEPVAPRRRPGRPPKNGVVQTPKAVERLSIGGGKADTQYENVPYKGLNFQQAQEKIVEELIRRREEEDEWAYFEPFMNLPPRALKDYYQLIEEPISLKKLQKLVKGVHGRGDATGVSDFKSWAAFEEKASLLWENAFYYNEEGSDISELAKELKDAFLEEVQEAKQYVEEPPQPKIKLKSASAQELLKGPKKITIHVGGRGSSAGSPAPPTGRSDSAPSDATPNGAATRTQFAVTNPAALNLGQLDKARSVSIAGASPSPSAGVKREDVNRQSPAVGMRPMNGLPAAVGGAPPAGYNAQAHHPGLPNGHGPVAPSPGPPYDIKHRLPGKTAADALITNLCIRTHQSLNQERRFVFNLPAHPKEAQQSVTINLPINHWKIQIIPRLNSALEHQQRPYKLFVIVNGQTLGRQMPSPQDPVDPGCQVFDAQLHAGVNTIMIQMIAAVPKGQKLPNGADAELEKITVLANLLKY